MAYNVAFSFVLLGFLAPAAYAIANGAANGAVSSSATVSSAANSVANTGTSEDTGNPIRKVVTMLQMMSKKVEEEGKKEEELYEKFVCYCKSSGTTLSQSIADNDAKIPQVQSDIEEAEQQLATTKQELAEHQSSRDEAKAAMAKATAMREKEHAAFVKESDEMKATIGALEKAIPAIEKGMAGGFLQTSAGKIVRQLALSDTDLTDFDREQLASFMQGSSSGGEGYVPKSGQIVGILKEMNDEFNKNLDEVEAQEAAALKIYDELMASKTKEVEAHTAAIERKTVAIGELSVEIVNMKNDLSFLQLRAGSEKAQAQAFQMIKKFKQKHHSKRPDLDLLALALAGKKVDFSKVLKMIDDMVALLKKEQTDDDHKKEYCEGQLDFVEDKAKELQHTISDLETQIADKEEILKTLKEELQALADGIKALDLSVQEATIQRKKENEEYVELMASNTAAKQLIDFAKNRMNKFYNPKLYKAPPKKELTEEERIEQNMGGSLAQTGKNGKKDAPPPPPETFEGEYSKKSEESNGVIGMMDLLIRDLEKEMTVAETEEKNSQEEYEELMDDSAAKRADDTKAIAEKESAKAETEEDLVNAKGEKDATTEDLDATKQYTTELHGECDWLIENFQVRKDARAEEVSALKDAKAVLSGADFSFAQQKLITLRKH